VADHTDTPDDDDLDDDDLDDGVALVDPLAALGGLGGGAGGLGGLLAQAQQAMAEAQQIGEEVVEGRAGGGVVRVEVNGRYEFSAVHIDPAAIDPDDLGLLEDLVLVALNDAASQITARQAAIQQRMMGGLGGAGLGGLFGGA
jgi:DNA-binding YbaB/EbfC family protein